MTAFVHWPGQDPLAIPVKYSKRKTLVLHVSEHGAEVRAPMRTSQRLIDAFVQDRAQWLQETLAKQKREQNARPDYLASKQIPFLGSELPWRWEAARQSYWLRTSTDLILRSPNDDRAEHADLLKDFLKEQAERLLPSRTRLKAEQLGLPTKLKRVRFRFTKTQWGHCTAKGVIQYNPMILMAPDWVVDYLISHEVSHLRHLDHSPAFWQTVASLTPQMSEARSWLRTEGRRLRFDP